MPTAPRMQAHCLAPSGARAGGQHLGTLCAGFAVRGQGGKVHKLELFTSEVLSEAQFHHTHICPARDRLAHALGPP